MWSVRNHTSVSRRMVEIGECLNLGILKGIYDNQNGSSLRHYGVLGMKWGIRKNPDKAYAKASSKLRKLDKKLVKRNAQMSKAYDKAAKKRAKATNEKKQRKAEKAMTKYYKSMWKSDKAKKKAYSWYDKITKTFEGVTLKDVRQEDIDLGYAYAQMFFEDARRGYG